MKGLSQRGVVGDNECGLGGNSEGWLGTEVVDPETEEVVRRETWSSETMYSYAFLLMNQPQHI